MNKALLYIGIAAVLFVSWNQAKASVVIFSDFSAGYGYRTDAVWGFGGPLDLQRAEPFTPTGNSYTLDSIKLAVELESGTDRILVSLVDDSSGRPGTSALESFSVTGLAPWPAGSVLTVDSLTHPVLNAGTQYWLVLVGGDSTTSAGWNLNSVGLSTESNVYRFDGGAWGFRPLSAPGAFETNGTVIPEPATLSLSALGCLAMLRRRR
jgi:hypothetical protein